jgi:hypothetical protein
MIFGIDMSQAAEIQKRKENHCMVEADLVVQQLDACETDIISIVELASKLISLLQSSKGADYAEEDDRKAAFETSFTLFMNTLDVSRDL